MSTSQLAGDTHWAPVANDFAIALFVLDLSLIISDELHTDSAERQHEPTDDEGTFLEPQTCRCCAELGCTDPRLT